MRFRQRLAFFNLCLVNLMMTTLALAAQQQPPSGTATVTVTARALPTALGHANRDIIVLTSQDIHKLPVRTFMDLIAYINGLYFRVRGPFGIQADAAFRGGTYEQVLVLVNGVAVNDPQTGHFNLNVPLTLDAIDRIEITRGPTLHFDGSRAMAGAIHIITRTTEKTGITADFSGGEHQWFSGTASTAFTTGKVAHTLTFQRVTSNGYRENTDFETTLVNYQTSFSIANARFHLFTGFFDKSFGANSFYSERFPLQWEANQGGLLTLESTIHFHRFDCESRTGFRLHHDRFLLIRNNPDFYENRHTARSYTLNAQCHVPTHLGETLFGWEWTRDDLRSTLLGKRTRTTQSLFFLQALKPLANVQLNLGGTLRKDDGTWRFWPSLDLGYHFHPSWHLFTAVGWSFRLPTFTELYYQSPANIGNPHLSPEKAWTAEIGLRHTSQQGLFQISLFYRDHQNVIDWIRLNPTEPWQAVNFGRIRTHGAHLDFAHTFKVRWGRITLHQVSFGYSLLHASRGHLPYDSKYAFALLDQQFIGNLTFLVVSSLMTGVTIRYERPHARSDRWLVDVNIRFPAAGGEFYLDILNLTDRRYETFPGVIMPGRWVIGGFRFTIF